MHGVRSRRWLWASLGCMAVVALTGAEAAPPWQPLLEGIAGRQAQLAHRLEADHRRLEQRLRRERPELLPRLSPPPAPPSPTGYGVLPPLEPDATRLAPLDAPPTERKYSLPELEAWLEREEDRERRLAQALDGLHPPFERLVDDDHLLSRDSRLIDEHVHYHRTWQQAVRHDPQTFERANRLLPVFRHWRQHPEDAAARAQLEPVGVSFTPVPWHHIQRQPDGSRRLVLPLLTDIGDAAFLAQVKSGVERVWNEAAPMRAARLRLELQWVPRDPHALYPEGVPAPGAPIDEVDHLTRFGPGYVLTTGGSTTHVQAGRAIVLSGAPVGIRVLAHEFSHLLGFADGYLRPYEGSPQSADGVVFYELTPFPSNLLAAPGEGQVSELMVQDLLRAYDPP